MDKHYFVAMGLVFSSCEKLDLKRDNPLDQYNNPGNSTGGNPIDMVDSIGAEIGYDSYKVRSDGNGDGFINRGESVKIDVRLKNNGTVTAKGVKAVFSTTSEYVSDFSPRTALFYGDIKAYESIWSGGFTSSAKEAFGFVVSKEVPAGAEIPIKIEMEDAYGNTWKSEFVLNVY
ncbi:MAG: hypothetical protein NC324_01050 [Bacteroides sp.]|nr:hypothetical protein [Bacteroides sp.]